MNQKWSELNRIMQSQLRKRETYREGMAVLYSLRNQLMQVLTFFRDDLTKADFSAMPFANASGLHHSTVAYSVWHIFRIEDITAHTLTANDEQVFFSGGYQKRIGSPIITTGNELSGQQIADFSAQLDIDALYDYASAVKESTERILNGLTYEMLKHRIPPERRAQLLSLNVVSQEESAVWLIDYWCKKQILGLIQMPFSRHWIMHTEACLRIKNKIQ